MRARSFTSSMDSPMLPYRRSSDASVAEFDGLIEPTPPSRYSRGASVRRFWTWCDKSARRVKLRLPTYFRSLRTCSIGRRRLLWRAFLSLFTLFIICSIANGLLHPSYATFPDHYRQFEERAIAAHKSGAANPENKQIFIAANIVQVDAIRGAWGESLLELVSYLGYDNVFVSIYENDSGDETPRALRDLRSKLRCNSSVVTGDHVDIDTIPMQKMPNGEQRTRRLEYLAELRNRMMKPLDEPSLTVEWAKKHPEFHVAEGNYDRVLFLNDVYFKPMEAVHLLFSTKKGDYSVACAADFNTRGMLFYDSFVVRDLEGYGMGWHFYPWFAPVGKAESRNDVLAEKDAVRVRSCWSGMASFDASIFQQVSIETRHGNITAPGVRFRASTELFWEESECCLVFADNELRMAALQQENRGVFLNPYIRVAYKENTWNKLAFWRRWERSLQYLQYIISKIGFPEYNPRRTNIAGSRVVDNVWHFKEGEESGSYEDIDHTVTPGSWCGQKRMFVLKKDFAKANEEGKRNWEKYPVPWW